MRNKKLIHFEVIEKAVAGEPEAVTEVLRHYTAHIKYLSADRHMGTAASGLSEAVPQGFTHQSIFS